jgi:hypothetical protein
MAPVRDNVLKQSPTPRRWSRKRALLLALGGAIALPLLFQFMAMPWLVRARVVAALRAAGFDDVRFKVTRATLWGAELANVQFATGGAARVEIGYGPLDLWHGRIDVLRVTSLRYGIDSSAPATTRPSRSFGGPIDLPVRKVELVDSQVVLTGDRPLEIPLRASLEQQGGRYAASVTAGEGDSLLVHASVGRTLGDGKVSVEVRGLGSELAMRVARALVGDTAVNVDGRLNGNMVGEWGEGSGRVYGGIEISDGKQSAQGKLNLWGGVYSVDARVAPSTRPTMELKVEGASFSTPDLVAEGVSGAVSFSDLNPPATPRPQSLTGSRVTLGGMELTDGRVEFEVKPGGEVLMRQANWKWLGGTLSAGDFVIPRVGPMNVTVHLRGAELAQVLDLLPEKKASGRGKLSGDLPLIFDGPMVRFGDGMLSSVAGGNVQIKDAGTLAAAAQAVAPAGGSQEQVKNNIVQALSDFEYDRLTARLVNESDGLAAYVRMSGHGRTGARQALDYELRVHGLDAVLRSYASYRKATSIKPATTGKAGP